MNTIAAFQNIFIEWAFVAKWSGILKLIGGLLDLDNVQS